MDCDEKPDDTKPTGSMPRRWLRQGLVQVLILIIRSYQTFISPLTGPSCRFMPTCSSYAIGALRKHGPIRGSWAAVKRICRCHPWNPGGYDPP